MKLTSLFGKKVYSVLGKYVGDVVDVIIDLKEKKITKIDVCVKLPPNRQRILIPYTWLSTVGDVILIKQETHNVAQD